MFYVKHLRGLMQRAGAQYSSENKILLDKAVREILEMERADAQDVWEVVKSIMFDNPDKQEKKDFEDEVVKLLVKKLING